MDKGNSLKGKKIIKRTLQNHNKRKIKEMKNIHKYKKLSFSLWVFQIILDGTAKIITLSKVVLNICKEIFKIIILKMLEDKKI